MSPAQILIYAILAGTVVGMALMLTLTFNPFRYRRLVERRVHPLLVRQGLRKRGDLWRSSGVEADVREYELSIGPEESRPFTRPEGMSMEDVLRAEHLPSGPYRIVHECQARRARALYESQDWYGANTWVGYSSRYYSTPYHYSREAAWKNEVLYQYGLSRQSLYIRKGIWHRSKGISLFNMKLWPEAYVLACRESLDLE